MPETPKRFEEVRGSNPDCRAPLPPQAAAAVPARQDAVPDGPKTSVGCEARGHTWNTYNPAWATKCIVCGFEPPVASTQPTQTAAGEGELTVVTARSAEGVGLDFYYAASVDALLDKLRTERDQAIAQRDEVWDLAMSQSVGLNYDYERKVFINTRAEQAEAQRDEARRETKRLERINEEICRDKNQFVQMNARLERERDEARVKLTPLATDYRAFIAALDVPKPESGTFAYVVKCHVCNCSWATDYTEVAHCIGFRHPKDSKQFLTVTPWDQYWADKEARLRSLPSEPSLGNQEKAAENGD